MRICAQGACAPLAQRVYGMGSGSHNVSGSAQPSGLVLVALANCQVILLFGDPTIQCILRVPVLLAF
jgi:hypothetical protein